MKYQKSFSILVAVAVLFSICSIVPKRAIAIPTNNRKGCVDDRELKKGPLEFYIIYDPENASTNSHASINIREKPTIKSRAVHLVSSGNPVIILQQVVKDDYCWLKVNVTTLSKHDSTSYITVTGWVRGDLVTEDKSP
jgi:Bacterial SH3 domain